MDKRTQEALINREVAQVVNRMRRRSDLKSLIVVVVLLIAFVFTFLISKSQLQSASGVFEVPLTSDRRVISEDVVDASHFFDDSVSSVQAFTALELNKLFTHTTTSFPKLTQQLNSIAIKTFAADLRSNFETFQIHKHLDEESKAINSLTIRLESVPTVINAFTEDEESYSNFQLSELNTLRIKTWRVEVSARVILKTEQGKVRKNPKVYFVIDVEDLLRNGKRRDMRFSVMTKWEQI